MTPQCSPSSPLDSAEIESRLSAIEVALRGDLKGNAGALQNLIRLMNDVYNTPDGIKPRVGALENWKVAKEERFAGAIWIVRVGWSVIGGSIVWALQHIKI